MKLGNYIKELRGKTSLRDAAEKIGISHTYLDTVEKGFDKRSGKPVKPTPETLELISQAYDCDYGELMTMAGYIRGKHTIYLYAEDQSPSEDWVMLSFEKQAFTIPKGTCILAHEIPSFILEEDVDSDSLVFQIAKRMGIPDFTPHDLDRFDFSATRQLIDNIDATSRFGSAASRKMLLSLEEIELLDEIRKNPKMKIKVAAQTAGSAQNNKIEKDIAKRLEEFKKDLTSSDGLNFSGEPMSDDAKESLIEAMDHIFRQTQRINKKYIPNKHKKDED